MHTNKLLLEALRGKRKQSTPIWIMRQAGRYLPEYRDIRSKESSFLRLCYTPKTAAKISLLPIERFHFDACIVFSDILVIPDALGQKVEFVEKQGPILQKISTEKDLHTSISKNFDTLHAHLQPIYETIDILKTQIPKDVALIGFAGAPWTVATYMIGGRGKQNIQDLARWVNNNMGFFTILLDILVEATAQYLIKQIEAGAEVLQIFDSWAGKLSAEDFENFSIKPVQNIIEKVKAMYPKIPIIGFPKDAGIKIPTYVKETKVDAVSVEDSIDIQWAKDAIQSLCPLQGCLSSNTLLTGENLERETLNILETFKDRAHIFNLGHGIQKDTPISNVERMLRIVRDFKAF